MRIPAEHNVTPPTLDCYAKARDAFLGDTASELAALLIDHVRESRQSYLEQTRAEEHQLRLVQAAQVEDMRTQADKLRDAGISKGAGMIASGLLTVGSGVSIASTGTADNPYSKYFDGSAKGAEGGGQLMAAHFDHDAGIAGADATEHEHLGSEAERRLETLDEARSYLKELQRTAFEHLQNIQETQAGTDRTLTSWRG